MAVQGKHSDNITANNSNPLMHRRVPATRVPEEASAACVSTSVLVVVVFGRQVDKSNPVPLVAVCYCLE